MENKLMFRIAEYEDKLTGAQLRNLKKILAAPKNERPITAQSYLRMKKAVIGDNFTLEKVEAIAKLFGVRVGKVFTPEYLKHSFPEFVTA